MDTINTSTRAARAVFEARLSAFKFAAEMLSEEWSKSNQPGGIFGDSYPSYLPSFDEFVTDVLGMELQPEPLAAWEPITDAQTTITVGMDGAPEFVQVLRVYNPDNDMAEPALEARVNGRTIARLEGYEHNDATLRCDPSINKIRRNDIHMLLTRCASISWDLLRVAEEA